MLFSEYYCDWCFQKIKGEMLLLDSPRGNRGFHLHGDCAKMLKVQNWQDFASLKGKLICTDCLAPLPVDEWPTCAECIEKRQGSS